MIENFVNKLKNSSFNGEISNSDALRTVYSTDNSIYERKPQLIIFPKNNQDIQTVMELLQQFPKLHLTAKGGGTGTNGQSLTNGIVLDLSKFMNKILEIDPINKTATVQAGVVKDQLNEELKKYGLFFAPELSTSNRATIGGMINTDASGQGSLRYGKTHNHVLSLKSVLLGGELFEASAIKKSDFVAENAKLASKSQEIKQNLFNLAEQNQELIKKSFPKLTRSLTGYDLPNLLTADFFNPHLVLCGAEGSLAIIAEAKVNLVEIPKHRALINIAYADFNSALSDASNLLKLNPLSIETVDSKVLNLAKGDIVWESVKEFFKAENAEGINIVELNAETEADLEKQIQDYSSALAQNPLALSFSSTKQLSDINAIYGMRKKAVGLLGNTVGEKRPQPFVEDSAVPPENLAAYILELRQFLDDLGLDYGMFGHIDAGVLHLRPALDMKEEKSKELVRIISEKVVELTHKYGGVLWGEHGKGLRSSFAPKFFGDCWELVQKVKAIFDPENQLNQGKIATAFGSNLQLTQLLEVPLRGERDKIIPVKIWNEYGSAMHCNGNGACFNYSWNEAICPSYKVSRDRRQSPKGRAALIKEWLIRKELNTLTAEFENEVFAALKSCLSCKACASQCPIKVDIPEVKAKFLDSYYQNHRRQIRHYLIGYLEYFLPFLAKIKPIYNFFLGSSLIQKINEKILGLSAIPLLSKTKIDFSSFNAEIIKDPKTIKASDNAVILVPDAFTRYFDSEVLRDLLQLLKNIGIKKIYILDIINGKTLHIQGFLGSFKKLKAKNEAIFAILEKTNIPMVGLDPALTLAFRQEYLVNTENPPKRKILLIQEFLLQILQSKELNIKNKGETYFLAGHCSEKTQIPNSTKQWQEIFNFFGLELKPVAVGCCGMAGVYGHQKEMQENSQKLFNNSWLQAVNNYGDKLLTSGYSCRSQAKRMKKIKLKHPVQVLLAQIANCSLLKC